MSSVAPASEAITGALHSNEIPLSRKPFSTGNVNSVSMHASSIATTQ